MQVWTLLAVHQVRAEDDGPDEHKQDRRHRGDHGERADYARVDVEHHHTTQQTDAGEGQPFRRYRAFRQFGKRARSNALLRQAEQHTAGGEDAAVRGRGRRGQHHEVNQARGSRQSHQHEQLDERALGWHHRTPWRHGHNDDQREYVEHDDTQRNGVDRARQGFLRIFGFRRRGTDQLNPDKREHRNLEAGKEAADPFREPAAVIPQMGKRRLYAGWRLEVRQHHHQPDDNQRDDGDDFDHREPELHLTEHFNGGEVQAQQQNNHRQRSHPVRQAGEPELGVGRNSDNIRHAGNHPAEPVGPAGKIARPRAEQV